ncbi:hypothetical protein SAY86_000992 [Trapa natans]|uniref:Cytochrome P450 87A3 n=1 Tax=Trapa natans TaxID=22666 RepID=A0AAN7REC5_TRANT|nr:hypothetical protein SAY86_000992 [Trapa natans]
MWAMCIVTFIVVAALHIWVYKWRNPKRNGKLPPGSMGLPLLGETLQFFAPYRTHDISPFIKERLKRYGPIFKTHLLGQSMIVSTDADLNYFVFQQEGSLFQSCYPYTLSETFGEQNMGSLHGFLFKYLKNIVLSLFGPVSLQTMLPEVEKTVVHRLKQWSFRNMVEAKDEIANVIFSLTAGKLISYDSDNSSENIRANFATFIKGLISFPVNIPGTAFHKCLQGRQNAMRMLKKLLQERRENPRKQQRDFFDYVLEELDKEGTMMNETMALNLIFALLFASYETVSEALTLGMKFLSDHPSVLQRLTNEYDAILRQRKEEEEGADSGITWGEYKSMAYTLLANIVPGIFRKVLKDIQFKGYTIPEGWGLIVCPPAVHLNPSIYEDPLTEIGGSLALPRALPFPTSWGIDTSNASKQFMAFGGGMRLELGESFRKSCTLLRLWCSKITSSKPSTAMEELKYFMCLCLNLSLWTWRNLDVLCEHVFFSRACGASLRCGDDGVDAYCGEYDDACWEDVCAVEHDRLY